MSEFQPAPCCAQHSGPDFESNSRGHIHSQHPTALVPPRPSLPQSGYLSVHTTDASCSLEHSVPASRHCTAHFCRLLSSFLPVKRESGSLARERTWLLHGNQMFSVQGVRASVFNLSTRKLTDLNIKHPIPTSTRHFQNYANDEGSARVQNCADEEHIKLLKQTLQVQSISKGLL